MDPTGRRRRRLGLLAYGLGLTGLVYTAMVGVSFAGGRAEPQNVLPAVESTQRPWQPPPVLWDLPGPAPTVHEAALEAGSLRTEPIPVGGRRTETPVEAALTGSVDR